MKMKCNGELCIIQEHQYIIYEWNNKIFYQFKLWLMAKMNQVFIETAFNFTIHILSPSQIAAVSLQAWSLYCLHSHDVRQTCAVADTRFISECSVDMASNTERICRYSCDNNRLQPTCLTLNNVIIWAL